jgi:hypothetical protein
MTKNELLRVLKSLKLGRQSIVSEFCAEEPDLYRPMFAYKPFSGDMDVALSRYSFNWLSKHPSFYKEALEEEGASGAEFSSEAFFRAYRTLCESFMRQDSVAPGQKSPILEELVKSSVKYLDELLQVSDRSDERMRRLVYESEKSRHLFERRCENLKGSHNGNT